MTTSEMVQDFWDHLDSGSNFFSGREVMKRLHDAQQEILRRIVQEDPSFYVSTYDLSIVSGTNLYDLPLNARRGARILFTENPSQTTEIAHADLRAHFHLSGPGVISLIPGTRFMMQGKQVRIEPTPSASATFRVWYTPSYGNMLEGYVSAAAAASLSFHTADPNYSTNYGAVDRRDDFYNGMTVRIISGTGVGQERVITDYTGSTRLATVAAWDTALVTSGDNWSKFAVLCPVPEDHHSLVPLRAAMVGAVKNRNRLNDLSMIYHGVPGRPGALFELLGWIMRRQEAGIQTVTPIDSGY